MSNHNPLLPVPVSWVKVTIDNRLLEVEKGKTILQAAEDSGIYIPTLCAHKDLSPYGGCRLCVVEVEGVRGLPTACTTPVEEGMVIRTNTTQVQALRRDILQLLLSEHPHNCLFCEEVNDCLPYMFTIRKGDVVTGCNSCPQNEHCELQSLVHRLELDHIDYPFRYHDYLVEKYDPFYDRDYNLCILCGRCIRECQEVRGANVLSFKQRGSRTIIGPAYDRTHVEAGCEFCGACVAVCPTGTLSVKTSKWMGKPDREVLSTCALCGIGCQLILQVRNDEIMNSLPATESVVEGQLCVKGRFGIFETVNNPNRLREPFHVEQSYRVKVSWEEAAGIAAEQLKNCSPEQFGMLISPDCTNEDLYVAQKFTRVVMKSNHVDTTARNLYGVGFNSYLDLLRNASPLSELTRADMVLSIGLDTRYSCSVVGVELRKAMHQGAHLITIHPREHNLTLIADKWLKIHCGDTVHVFNRLAKLTTPPIPNQKEVPAVDYKNDAYRAELVEIANILQKANSPVFLVGAEFLQYQNCGHVMELIQKVACNIGAKVIPLVGQSNLVGSIWMGAYPELLPGGFCLELQEHKKHLETLWKTSLAENCDDWDSTSYSSGSTLKVLYHVGSLPLPGKVGADFEIFQNISLPEYDLLAQLVLPSAAFTEMDGSVVSEDGSLHRFHQAVKAPGMALPHWQILCYIAQKMGVAGFDFHSVEEIGTEIAELLPGWEGANQRGVPLHLWMGIEFKDNTHLLPNVGLLNAAAQYTTYEYPYILRTILNEETYQGFPLTGWVKGLRSLFLEEKLFVHPEDALTLGVTQGDVVEVSSPTTMKMILPVHLEPDQTRGTVSAILLQRDHLIPVMGAVAVAKHPLQERRHHV